ncbi:ion transporter [Halomonas tibetensis]|uniref:Ion transporter n=1 Tax=Halomonas tibetensis TaxID=2259590 RepID=A0ABV7B5H9_9GAMM
MTHEFQPGGEGLRTRAFQIIFESNTGPARGFDIVLIVMILASVLVVMLDSVDSYAARWGDLFFWLEWGFTIAFTLELAVRLYCLERPLDYLKSFYGVVDVIAVMPTWLALIIPGAQALLIVRVLRVLRIFRILRMMQFVGEGRLLMESLRRALHPIFLFLITVLFLVTIFASLIYLIEPAEAGFTSIPQAIYWAIVTLTTVGYGDIVPVTPLGQGLSVMVMLTGYSIIVVPTGVFSAEVIRSVRQEQYSDQACPGCGHDQHDRTAKYCLKCGTWLDEETPDPHLSEEEQEAWWQAREGKGGDTVDKNDRKQESPPG